MDLDEKNVYYILMNFSANLYLEVTNIEKYVYFYSYLQDFLAFRSLKDQEPESLKKYCKIRQFMQSRYEHIFFSSSI